MHVTYCTIRRSVLIKKLLLVLENVYLIPVIQLHMSLVHGVRIYNCLIFFFLGGGGKIVYKKKISRLNIRYTNYHETEKNHVRKLILSKESKILGLFIKIIFVPPKGRLYVLYYECSDLGLSVFLSVCFIIYAYFAVVV